MSADELIYVPEEPSPWYKEVRGKKLCTGVPGFVPGEVCFVKRFIAVRDGYLV